MVGVIDEISWLISIVHSFLDCLVVGVVLTDYPVHMDGQVLL